MNVQVNGKAREIPDGTTVAALVELLGLGGQPVAAEVNESVVPRSRHGAHTLSSGDRIELVTFVGGG